VTVRQTILLARMPEIEIPFHLPEDCPDRPTLKRIVYEALTGDLSFHRQIKDALIEAGFRVNRVRKHEIHHVWELRLERSPAILHQTDPQIRRRIRNAFRAEGLYCRSEGMEIAIQGRRIQKLASRCERSDWHLTIFCRYDKSKTRKGVLTATR
jgi:hypothetical protein